MDSSIQSIQILQGIVAKYGPPNESNITVYRGLMQDFLVDYTRELNILKIPLEQGLVFRLLKESGQIPFEILLQQMVTYLHTNFGIDKTAAKWAIEGWAEALGIKSIHTCIADFFCEPIQGIAPLQVHFINRSIGVASSFKWDFGDGTLSTEENPTHIYEKPGTYFVKFIVSDGVDSPQSEKKSTLEVLPDNFSANFICENNSGTAPFKTYFIPKYSSPHGIYHWTFGDGNNSDKEKPSHEYTRAGKYSVTLRITQDGFTDEKTFNDLISVTSIPIPEPVLPVYEPKPDELEKNLSQKSKKASNIKIDGIKGLNYKKLGIFIGSIAIILILAIILGGFISSSSSKENETELLKPSIVQPTHSPVDTTGDVPQKTMTPQVKEETPLFQPTTLVQSKKILIDLKGKSPYPWGEDIQISGKNTVGDSVYLFYEKKNGDNAGSMYNLENPPEIVSCDTPESYTIVPVKSKDHSWKYSWNTSSDELQRLVCSVYAVNSPVPLSDISKTVHAKTDAIIIGAKPTPTPDMSVDGSTSDSDSF